MYRRRLLGELRYVLVARGRVCGVEFELVSSVSRVEFLVERHHGQPSPLSRKEIAFRAGVVVKPLTVNLPDEPVYRIQSCTCIILSII